MATIDTTNSVGSTYNTAATSSGSSAKELENQFLSLLVAQLKNQDPTSPMESQQFVSELAQLQTLDQQQKLTATNQSLLLQSSLSTGASMIGKSVIGNVTQNGAFVEVTGLVQSLRVENGAVVFQVQTEDGLVSMTPENLKSVSMVN